LTLFSSSRCIFSLNHRLLLPAEDWQLQQARSSTILSSSSIRSSSSSLLSLPPPVTASTLCPPNFSLILSLDLNVFPSSSTQDAQTLVSSILSFYIGSEGNHVLRYGKKHQKAVLSTFGGGGASFGGLGWGGLLGMLKQGGLDVSLIFPSRLLEAPLSLNPSSTRLVRPPNLLQVFFIPSFFLPPHEIIDNPLINGIFAWNNGWPLTDAPLSKTKEDEPFVKSVRSLSSHIVFFCFF